MSEDERPDQRHNRLIEEMLDVARLVTPEQVREILKQHFPEYLSGFCLCGSPIGTYMMWIDHIAHLLEPEPSASAEENETGHAD